MGNMPEFGQLNAQEWNRLQDAAARFEQAWQSGQDPDLVAFLPDASDRLRPLVLRELIKIDLEMRVRRTPDQVRVDTYCESFPELGAPATLPASLIYEEYRVRHRYADRPELDTYKDRFPAQFAELDKLVNEPGTLRSIAAQSGLNYPTLTGPEASLPPPPPQVVIKPTGNDTLIPGAPGYRKLEYLGGGMFSDVWRGEAPGGCPVAIKIIRRPVDHQEVQGELKALELIKTLGHPFLAKIDAFWVVDGRMHVAMELAEKTLRQRLKECKATGLPALPLDELLTYTRDVAEVLDYLHSENIIHRDIKPENILLLKGHAKVADLGLARELEDQIQMSATSVGTPRYMAPEVWNRRVSKHSDQYSLAVTYAELRLGRSPFDSKDLAGAMLDAISGNANLEGMAEAEQHAVRKALAKNPEDRYACCVDFVRALDAALKMPALAQARPLPAPPSAAPTGRRLSTPRVLVPVAAVLLMVAVGLVLWRSKLFQANTADTEVLPEKPPVLKVSTSNEASTTPHPPVNAEPQTKKPKKSPEKKPAPKPPPPPPAQPPLYVRIVRGTAQVRCSFRLPDSSQVQVSGTAWVADRAQRLLITNHHVVENMAARGDARVVDVATDAELLFPIWQGDQPVLEKQRYEQALQQGKIKLVHARVLNSDPARDLALLQADELPEGVTAIPLAATSPPAGELLHSVGNTAGSQALWTMTQGNVRGVYHRTDHYANGQDLDAWVIENQSPTNSGDSGGPVVNDRGELVGVTSSGSGNPAIHLVGWFIEVREVKNLLAESAPWLACHSAEEHVKRAGYYLGRHLYSLAMADCDQALVGGRKDKEAYRIRGIARRRELDLDGALIDLNQAIASGAQDGLVYRERGMALLMKDRPREALADFDRAVRLHAADAATHYERGVARNRLQDWKGAVSDFTAAEQGGYKPVLDIYVGRGEANYELKNYAAVLKDSDNMLHVEELTTSQKAQAFSRGGDACAKLGQKDKALTYYSEALKLNPSDARTYNGRGLLRADNREYAQAIEDYTKAIGLEGTVPPRVAAYFYYNRGQAHEARGRSEPAEYRRAVADFSKAVNLDARESQFLDSRARTYRALKLYDKALADHAAALTLDDHNDQYFNARGLTYMAMNKYVPAADDFSAAIKLRSNAVYYYNRGLANEGLNDKARARDDYRKALKLKPGFEKAATALNELDSEDGGASQ